MAQFDLFRIPKRPWNSGRIIGAKRPFRTSPLGRERSLAGAVEMSGFRTGHRQEDLQGQPLSRPG
jgi:hypothetical protein